MRLLNIKSKLSRASATDQLRAPPLTFPVAVNPWRISHQRHRLKLINDSGEELLGVRVSVAGSAVCALSLPQKVSPGESLSVWVYEPEVACASAVVVVQWRNSIGTELLCPVPIT